MSETIVCRSPEQIRDDALVWAHEELTRAYRLHSGGRFVYLGQRSVAIQNLAQECERAITGEGPYPHNLAMRVAYVLRLGD